ncbi:MAG: hypothetical protein QF570_08410 [Myxococcota bacterium]|nr:hypothetical protein [Myxococcota bacterium]
MASIRLRPATAAAALPDLRGVALSLLACAFALAAFAVLAAPAHAMRDVVGHDADALRDGLDGDESEALDTLVLADASLRDAILDASLHPDVLSTVAGIQEESSAAFRRRLDAESRTTQKDVWELSRYPELVDEIVLGGRPTRGAIDEIVAPYPERIREIARGLALHHFAVVRDTAQIREVAERESRRALQRLPLTAQASFEALFERPDLLAAMVREPRVVERVASLAREDTWNARSVLDREHELRSAAREHEIEDWRETIENDPEAEVELRDSAERFAEEEGYDDPGGTTTERVEVHHYYHHPYPWWFGPPHWRVGLHWYPHRTHWGFHVTIGGAIIIHDVPSPTFSYWHYRRPHSHRHRYHRLHGHWARFGPRHHLHRDYRHRMHKRGHHGVRRGHRHHSTRPRHHTRSRPRAHYRRHQEPVNKFFRHDSTRHRDARNRPLHNVRHEERRRDDAGNQRVASRRDRDQDRARSKRDLRARDGSEARRKLQRSKPTRTSRDRTQKRRVTRRDSRSSSKNKLENETRTTTRKREGNRLTSSKRLASKPRSKVSGRSKTRSTQSKQTTNKFMRPSTRTAKKASPGVEKQTSRKLSSKSKHKPTTRAKSPSNKNTARKSTRKKSSKGSSGRSSNKFFARR